MQTIPVKDGAPGVFSARKGYQEMAERTQKNILESDNNRYNADPKKFSATTKKYGAERGFSKTLSSGRKTGLKQRAWVQVLESLKQSLKSHEQIPKV